ncbi:MAG: hypothetical protein ACEQR8_02435, partial [Cypionkella sp.]
MISRLLAAGASAVALAAAAPAFAEQQPAGAPAAPAPSATSAPAMSFGEWGFDPAGLDPRVDPGDDFFAYANGKWLAANPLPPEFSRYGAFTMLDEKSTADVKALVDELVAKDPSARSADEARIVAAYQAFHDTAAIDAAGMAPAQPYLAAIGQADSLGELAALWGRPGMPSPLGASVSVDAKEPTRYSVYFGAGGLGLPDRDNYLKETPRDRDIQAKYREYLAFLLAQAGHADAAGVARKVYDFEDRIARTVAWDRATRRNRDLTYNALTPAELAALDPAFPVAAFLGGCGRCAGRRPPRRR